MLELFVSPIRYFRSLLERPPRWTRAGAPVVVYAGLLAMTGSVTYLRLQSGLVDTASLATGAVAFTSPVFGTVLSVFSVVTGAAVTFWLSTGALIALDVLFTGSGRARRLIEFSALAYWTQVPWTAVVAGVVLWWFEPAPLRLAAGATPMELAEAMRAYQENSASAAGLSTMRLVGSYFWCWLVALQAAALRVVSGFSVGGAWAAGILLAILFVGIPYAGGLLW